MQLLRPSMIWVYRPKRLLTI